MSFKDDYVDFQYLALNLLQVRRHNLMEAIAKLRADGNLAEVEKERLLRQQETLVAELPPVQDHPERRLIFAEGALTLIALERFLRMILGRTGEAHRNVTLPSLLEEATGTRLNLLRFQPGIDRQKAITTVTLVRNTLLHGNFEQLAAEARCADVREFFSREYTPAVEGVYQLLDHFVKQIDSTTGRAAAALS